MSHDIPDQNQHPTGDGIAHLINHTPALPLLEAVVRYMEENTTQADRVFFASCVVQSLKAQRPVHQHPATISQAERIHATLHLEANRHPCACCDRHALNPDNPADCAAYTGTTDTPDGCEDTETPRLTPEGSVHQIRVATVNEDGYGVAPRLCPCGEESADQTGDCAPWCSPECADTTVQERAVETDRRQKAALKAINAAVNMGHTTFERLFLKWDSVDCPTCAVALDFTSPVSDFSAEVEVSCDCFGTVFL